MGGGTGATLPSLASLLLTMNEGRNPGEACAFGRRLRNALGTVKNRALKFFGEALEH
jgi:hypothetical protein